MNNYSNFKRLLAPGVKRKNNCFIVVLATRDFTKEVLFQWLKEDLYYFFSDLPSWELL